MQKKGDLESRVREDQLDANLDYPVLEDPTMKSLHKDEIFDLIMNPNRDDSDMSMR
jgi:hypothetical protein